MNPITRLHSASHRPQPGGGGGGGGGTFFTASNFTRPTSLATTPASQRKPFTTRAEMDALIAGAQVGDYIYYAGSGILVISSSSNNGYEMKNRKPAGAGWTLDLGTRKCAWDPTLESTNYVQFKYTGSSNLHAFYIHDCSNLKIYGGDFTTNQTGGRGIWIIGGNTGITMYDFYSHDLGADGIGMMNSIPSGGASGSILNCDVRGECASWGHNLALDPHNEKGTGLHGCQYADAATAGTMDSNRLILYAHDANNGVGINCGGQNPSAGPITNNEFYVLTENLTFAAQQQTAGNTIQFWGYKPLTTNVVHWAEGRNQKGAVVWAGGISSTSYVNGLRVLVGRHTNTNQNTNGTSGSVPFDVSHGAISYVDIDYP